MPWWAWLASGVAAGVTFTLAVSSRAWTVIVKPVLCKLRERDDWHTKQVKETHASVSDHDDWFTKRVKDIHAKALRNTKLH